MRYNTYHKVLVIAAPVALAVICCFAAVFILKHFTFPPCFSWYFLHIHCPGCGATRSVYALTQGNVLLAMRQNIAIPVFIVLAVLYYLEFALKVWGISFKIPFIHNIKFILSLLAIWFVYAVVRNFVPAIAPI